MKKPKGKKATKPASEVAIASCKHIHDEDVLNDYSHLDWGKAERGKYAKRYAEGTNVVLIAPKAK